MADGCAIAGRRAPHRLGWLAALVFVAVPARADRIELAECLPAPGPTAIERMPSLPEPLAVRDWRSVARDYYQTVFDPARAGEGFPAVQVDADHFRMKSYLGLQFDTEAFCCLAAVAGAELVGLDPQALHGTDYLARTAAWYDPEIGLFRHRAGQRGPVVSADIYGYWPAVLALHQTHAAGRRVVVGLGQSPDDEYGVELVRRGFIVLAPAYPHLADYAPDLRGLGYASGTLKAIWDNIRGLDLLASIPAVRTNRGFGCIGHSLGGHNGLFTAAFDTRIRVVVTSCGFDSFRDYRGGHPDLWRDGQGWCQPRYMPRLAAYRGKLDQIPFDFPEVLAAILPRRVFVNAPKRDSNFGWESVDRVVAAAVGLADSPPAPAQRIPSSRSAIPTHRIDFRRNCGRKRIN